MDPSIQALIGMVNSLPPPSTEPPQQQRKAKRTVYIHETTDDIEDMLTTNSASTGGEGNLTNTGVITANAGYFNADTGSLIANAGNLNANTSGLTDNGDNSHGNTDAVTGVNGTLNANTDDLTLRSTSQDRSTVSSVRQGNTKAENFISLSLNRGGVVDLHLPADQPTWNDVMTTLQSTSSSFMISCLVFWWSLGVFWWSLCSWLMNKMVGSR